MSIKLLPWSVQSVFYACNILYHIYWTVYFVSFIYSSNDCYCYFLLHLFGFQIQLDFIWQTCLGCKYPNIQKSYLIRPTKYTKYILFISNLVWNFNRYRYLVQLIKNECYHLADGCLFLWHTKETGDIFVHLIFPYHIFCTRVFFWWKFTLS